VRVLIGEPFPEVAQLLEHAVGHLGHEAVAQRGGWDGTDLPDVDVLVLEPELENGLELARALRREKPGLPVICTVNGEPGREVDELDPVATLVKPFALAELEAALRDAVRRAAARGRTGA
jgi:DNA-binding response OmpR family regulator